MTEFWNERYATEEYVYGTEPNQFFKEKLKNLPPGKILFPAEGEGRNAVHAAKQGWNVAAFDSSTQARYKAEKLAIENEVSVDYCTCDFEDARYQPGEFDCIVLIFAHIHPLKRKEYHQKMISFLKPGGTLILEGFSKKQINNHSGGPRNPEMLFSKQELQNDFAPLSEFEITETDIFFNEGNFHSGLASLIRVYGNK